MKGSDALKALNASVKAIVGVLGSYVSNPGKDFTRNRALSAETVIRFVLGMTNKSAKCEVALHSGRNKTHVTPQAYVKAVGKLLPSAFEDLFRRFAAWARPKFRRPKGKLRLFAIDGSSVRFVTNPKHVAFYHENADYDDFHLTVMHDVWSGLIVDAVLQPGAEYNEVDAARILVGRLDVQGATIVADRAFEAWSLMADCEDRGFKYLLRGKNSKSLGGDRQEEFDEDRVFHLSRSQAKSAKADPAYKFLSTTSRFDRPIEKGGFYEIRTRIVRFLLPSGKWETLVTNLGRRKFDVARLSKAYHERWKVETCFRRLKHTVDMMSFHSGKPEFVEMEIWSNMLVFNFAVAMAGAASELKPGRVANFAVAVTEARETARGRQNHQTPLKR